MASTTTQRKERGFEGGATSNDHNASKCGQVRLSYPTLGLEELERVGGPADRLLDVLRRQVPRPRYQEGDRAVLAALSNVVPRQRWPYAFLPTPATLSGWRRRFVNGWTYRSDVNAGRAVHLRSGCRCRGNGAYERHSSSSPRRAIPAGTPRFADKWKPSVRACTPPPSL